MNISRLLSVAPMMERTDRHCRYFFRLLSQQTLLYTEMINANAISSDLSGDDLIKKFRAWLDILDLRFDKIKVTCLGHQKTY